MYHLNVLLSCESDRSLSDGASANVDTFQREASLLFIRHAIRKLRLTSTGLLGSRYLAREINGHQGVRALRRPVQQTSTRRQS